MGNPLAHFEIAGKDGEKLESFYTSLFGWELKRVSAGGHNYAYIDTGANPGLTGGIRHEPRGAAEVVLYIEVSSVEEATRRAEELGGAVRIPPMSFEDKTFSLVQDPEGNSIGLLQRK